MKMALHLLITILISSLTTISYASDPSPLQDFCVAVDDSKASGNYYVLKKISTFLI